MLSYEDRIRMYKSKKLFIEQVSKVFENPTAFSNVEKITYEVYSKPFNEDTTYYNEFVVVTFKGGAISVRNISGNSNNANFRVIGQLIDGGYYDEVSFYEKIKATYSLVCLED